MKPPAGIKLSCEGEDCRLCKGEKLAPRVGTHFVLPVARYVLGDKWIPGDNLEYELEAGVATLVLIYAALNNPEWGQAIARGLEQLGLFEDDELNGGADAAIQFLRISLTELDPTKGDR